MRVFMFFINAIYWLWAFIVPVIVLGVPAIIWYVNSGGSLFGPACLLLAGVVLGVWVAEKIRRSEGGLTSFFSRLSETPDIDGVNGEKP